MFCCKLETNDLSLSKSVTAIFPFSTVLAVKSILLSTVDYKPYLWGEHCDYHYGVIDYCPVNEHSHSIDSKLECMLFL